jgi:hypothetical protein
MSIQKNINNLLDKNFENNDFLPKKLFIEDIDGGVLDYVKSLNITLANSDDNPIKVPVIFLSQERWAEFKMNWQSLTDESGEEINLPFMTISRISVKPGEHPLKRTIPVKKRFTFVKVANFDGILKGFDIYRIPQPPRIDIQYELRFFSRYMQDVNVSYEKVIAEGFSDGQGYMKINGYDIPLMLGTPSEENTMDDISADRKFQIVFPLEAYAKIVDPSKFEKVKTVTKVKISINELH